jgi:hypothetical protein
VSRGAVFFHCKTCRVDGGRFVRADEEDGQLDRWEINNGDAVLTDVWKHREAISQFSLLPDHVLDALFNYTLSNYVSWVAEHAVHNVVLRDENGTESTL